MSDTSVKKFEKEHCENQAECIKMIQSVLDGSATPEEMQHFKENIDKCKPCYDTYTLEKAIKSNHQEKVEKLCCPKKTLELLKLKLGFTAGLVIAFLIQYKLMTLLFCS